MICSFFFLSFFSFVHNSKTVQYTKMICTLNDCSEMFVFCFRAACELRLVSYVCTYAHNFKTTGCIWTFYISNNCSTIGDVYFLGKSCMWNRYDSWVMVLNMYHSLFPICHLCALICITWKLQVVYGCSAYWITTLLSEAFLAWFKVKWEIWPESYSPRHAS